MEQSRDRPMKDWSDEEVLEQYRTLTGDLPDTPSQNRLNSSAITEEMLRRGLSFSDVAAATPVTDTVDWSGEGGGEDPGSGALRNPV